MSLMTSARTDATSLSSDVPPPRPSFGDWLGGSSSFAKTFRLLLSFALAALVWEIVARYFVTNRLILVPFSEVVQALILEVTSGQLWIHARTTLLEIAIGYPIGAVIGIVASLPLITAQLAGLIMGQQMGLGLASVVGKAATAGSGGMVNLPPVGLESWMLGLGLMLAIGLLVGALPAMRGMRLNIVDALAGR